MKIVILMVMVMPLSSMQLHDRINNGLKAKYSSQQIDRVLKCWDNFAEGKKFERYLDDSKKVLQTADCYIEGLSAKPFHDLQQYSWVQPLETNYQTIYQELQAFQHLQDQGFQANQKWLSARDQIGSAYGPQWKTLGLQDRSVWNEAILPHFQQTQAILTKALVPSCEVFFAKQAPLSGIQPHSDRNNFILTCHLGLDVPEGDCWIEVGQQRYYWKNGQACIFDTSIIHQTENTSKDKTRYVLLIRFWHPELTTIEIEALQLIFAYLDHAAYGEEAMLEFEWKNIFMGKDASSTSTSSISPTVPAEAVKTVVADEAATKTSPRTSNIKLKALKKDLKTSKLLSDKIPKRKDDNKVLQAEKFREVQSRGFSRPK
jgi:aspartyl/asparaginyl beta-hydroxylase (cupin superfamily)